MLKFGEKVFHGVQMDSSKFGVICLKIKVSRQVFYFQLGIYSETCLFSKINIMTGFLPHEFLSNQISSVAVSVMCRTRNLIVGVQYQSILEFFFSFCF